MVQIEQWGVLELKFLGRKDGNPFTDDTIQAVFTGENGKTVKTDGFYDGDGVYIVRFMPEETGHFSYEVSGSFQDASTQNSESDLAGGFAVIAACSPRNHGPVRVYAERYLAYADGTPYYSIGTTCYAWANQTDALQEQTLRTLAKSSFNKIRFCFFPKFYRYNTEEPVSYPYVRGVKRGQDRERAAKAMHIGFHTDKPVADITDFDCYQFNTEHFRRFDKRISQLRDMGIEADMILLHPYDKWGFSTMQRECDELYLRYIVARYGCYRNIWWSMANEYDLMTKTTAEWKAYGELVKACDPYNHLRSIHNCLKFYDHHEDWITHCSLQRIDLYRHVEETDHLLEEYQKPVVWDEIAYEGNIMMGWGNITGQEMVRRFWEAFLRGGHAGHGETYLDPDDILWWSKGGVLHGTSEPRLAFLHQIMQQTPGGFMKYGECGFDEVVGIPYTENRKTSWTEPAEFADYEIHYYGFEQPAVIEFDLPEEKKFRAEVIDTWNMTITDMGIHSGYTAIQMPGRQYMAIRLIREV